MPKPLAMARNWVRVAGGALPVRVTGEGRTTIVGLHGWTLDGSIWNAQHEGLPPELRMISFDRRGFGQSMAAPGLGEEVHDVAAILDANFTASAWLIGQSQGARVALAFARRFPGRVDGIILQGAPAMGQGSASARSEIPLARYADGIARGDILAVRHDWLSHPLMHTSDPALARRLTAMVARWDGQDVLAPATSLASLDERLEQLQCPVLVITGEDEPESRQDAARTIAGAIPRSELRVIEEGGHLCNAERPQAFNAALAGFIARNPI